MKSSFLEEDGVIIKDKDDNVIEKEVETINWEPEMAQKEGYDYFMIKEIKEQDIAIQNTLH